MRHVIYTVFVLLVTVGLAGCGNQQPSTTTISSEATTQSAAPEAEGEADSEVDESFVENEQMVSLNGAYRMDIIGDWSVERVEANFPGFVDSTRYDPAELWQVTHPEVQMQGEIMIGADMPPTAPRPLFVIESMTEEAVPELSSQYGNAFLVEGIFESVGEEFYRVTLVTDHHVGREISEAQEFFGDRLPPPRFYLMMHQIDPVDFEQYRQSQARQDLLEMLRTMEIETPEIR